MMPAGPLDCEPGIPDANRCPQLLSVQDAEQIGARALPRDVRDFVAGGSGGEVTLAANRAALDRVQLVPRVLNDVSACAVATELAGCAASMPVAVAPMAFQLLVHSDGELGLAHAARQAGIPFAASMLSSYPIEEIAAVGAATWLQVYWLRDRAQVLDLIRRGEQAGCRALILTVDVPVMGRRLRDLRNGFAFPPGVTAANLSDGAATLGDTRVAGSSAAAVHTAQAFDPSLSWKDVGWIRDQTDLPLVLKGILDPRDARRAADMGVDGLIVSNHGGRQLDGAVASITALPAVCDAVAGRCEVLLDSGIRSGTDVLKAMAMGASGVLLGRPALWGLANGGARGAAAVLTLLKEELTGAMALAGCPDLAAVRELHTVVAPGQEPSMPVPFSTEAAEQTGVSQV
jgi:4-hydroxymandelate oxidase